MRYTIAIIAALVLNACTAYDDVPPGPAGDVYTARDVVHPLWIGYCRKVRRCDNPDMDVPPCTDQLEARTCAGADCDAPATEEAVTAALDCMDLTQAMACGSEVGGPEVPGCFAVLMAGIPGPRGKLAH